MSGMVGEAFLRVRPNTATFGAETKVGVAAQLAGINKGGGAASGVLRGLGAGGLAAGLGLTAVGAAAVGTTVLLAKAVGQAATLEQTLNVFEVTAGATAVQMGAVSERAKALGADLSLPATSANDAATAMTQLSKGGLSITDSLAGAKGVLQLAAAAMIDVGTAADITARALSAFELPGTEATHIADLLAGASIAATGEMSDMALALQQSAAVAHAAGIPIETLVGEITLLAKAGIIGSDAGTSLKTTMLRMIPTSKEAADVVKALGIQVADSGGNILSQGEIWEQYRVQLSKLTPVVRQQALATIFGSDGIRSANLLYKAGAKGLADVTREANRAGAAQDLAGARAKGLKGQFSGLVSQLETLGATVGTVLLPALTGIVSISASVVGALNGIAGAAIGVTNAIGDAIGAGAFEVFDKVLKPTLGPVKDGLEAIGGEVYDLTSSFVKLTDGQSGADLFANMVGGGGSASDSIAPVAAKVKKKLSTVTKIAKLEGEKTGAEYDLAVSKGIIANAREGVASAQRMAGQVARAGNEAIMAAAKEAKTNLTGLGDELATMAGNIIDNGPLGKQIKRLQESLNIGQDKGQKSQLGRSLRDASKELADAKKQVGTAAGRTAGQQAAVDQFLQPFVEKVKDAKAALGEFNTESIIERLQKSAEKQKEVVTKGISDVIAAFNAGRIDADEANRRIASTLAGAKAAYKVAGATLGAAFRDDFAAQLEGLKKQIDEIVRGPQTSAKGNEPDITSPSDVAAEAGRANADAQRGVADAQKNLEQVTREQLGEDRESNALLRSIDAQLSGIRTNTAAGAAKGRTNSTTHGVVAAEGTGSGRR